LIARCHQQRIAGTVIADRYSATRNQARRAATQEDQQMSTLDRTVRIAIAGALALGALGAYGPAAAAEAGKEQCAGIIKAGMNDCATKSNACHGHVESDANPEAWIYLPAGTCERLVGAHVVHVKDPTPKK
jgi:uncharacterized membrane protein